MLALALVLAVIRSTISTPTCVDDGDRHRRRELERLHRRRAADADPSGVDGGRGGRARDHRLPGRDRRGGRGRPRALAGQASSSSRASACSTARIEDPAKQAAAQSVTPDQIEAYVAANPRLDPEQRTVRVLETRSRARADAGPERDRPRPDLDERGQALRPRPRTDDRQDATTRRLRAARPQDDEGDDHPLRDVRLPDHEDHAQAPRADSTSSARRRGRSCPRRRSGTRSRRSKRELRAKWLPRTVCAPPVATHRGLREPPIRRVTRNRAPARRTGPKSRTSADVRLAPLPALSGPPMVALVQSERGLGCPRRSTRSRCLMRWPWMVLRPRDRRGRA